MFHHVIDISGTGWATDATAEQIATMNRHRTEQGLSPAEPVTNLVAPTTQPSYDFARVEDSIAAGDLVYLVNFTDTGAALAAYYADLDYDGVIANLPHGQAHRLIEVRGLDSWTARTVAEVAAFIDWIEWLSKALPAAGLGYAAPVRRDAYTTNPTWNEFALRRIHKALATRDAVWTTVLDTQAALYLAKQAGIPRITEVEGVLVTIQEIDPGAVLARAVEGARDPGFVPPSLPWPGPGPERLPLPGDALKSIVDTAWRRRVELLMFIEDDIDFTQLGMRGGGKSSAVDKLMAQVQAEGRDDALYVTGDPHGHRYEMFAWTDRAGTLNSGDFTNLRNDLRRRDDQDLPDIAFVYALGADAQLVQLQWAVEYDSALSANGAPRFQLTLRLPDGGQVTGTYRTKGHQSS